MNTTPKATVRHELGVQLIVPGDASIALPVTLSYHTNDPYAIHARFQTGLGDGVTWVFARETLAAGIEGPTGEGDVRVWPNKPKTGLRRMREQSQTVTISLSSPDGQALLEAPVTGLTTFLLQTYSLVGRGEESEHLDIDNALISLLDQAS